MNLSLITLRRITYLAVAVIITFFTSISSIAHALSQASFDAINEGSSYYDPSGVIGGTCGGSNAGSGPTATLITAAAQGLGPTKDGHSLPAASGGMGLEEKAVISGNKVVLAPGTSNPGASLSLAPKGVTDRDAEFYINMRWRYSVWAWSGNAAKGPESASWYNDAVRKVKVTNTVNGKSIVAAVIESGPAPHTGSKEGNSAPGYWQGFVDGTPSQFDGRVGGLAPAAFQAISSPKLEWTNGSGDKVNFEWVDDATLAGTVSGGGTLAASTDVAGATAIGKDCTATAQNNTTGFVFYDQFNSAWRDHPYGTSTIGDSGCGPSAVAMVVATLTGDHSVTPVVVADFGTQNGAYITGQGSSYQKMLIDGPVHFGLKSKAINSIDEAISTIKAGGLVIAAGTGAIPYTESGHIIVLRGVTNSGKILIGDSDGAHKGANQKEFDQSEIISGNSGLWAVTK